MSKESSLWSWLAQARTRVAGRCHLTRIENCISAGTPDVEGQVLLADRLKGQFWLELKSNIRPARRTTPIRFSFRNREAQIQWMKTRWDIGGNAFFLLQVGSNHDRTLYLAPGNAGRYLAEGMIESDLMIACCNTGVFPSPISHEDLFRRIIQCRSRPSLMVP